MKSICLRGARVLSACCPEFVFANVLCRNGKIEKVGSESFSADEYVDLHGKYLIPGFIDAHTHGRIGYDFNTADAGGIARMLKSYYQRGVTGVFPTLASSEFDMLLKQIKLISEYRSDDSDEARIYGVHLEGRYLNPDKRGAHAIELLSPPNTDEARLLLSAAGKRLHVSAAFELDSNDEFISELRNGGATLGLAHTSADYATAKRLYEEYGISLTHMFNAMNPLHHRAGGAVSAGLTSEMYTEIIADGIHVSPEMLALAYRCKGYRRLVLITDSMEATDSPDGEYSIAGMPVTVKNSIARTHEGALAGSTLNLVSAINNLCRFAGASYEEAILCATANPARMLGIYDVTGSIEEGKNADLLIADICSDGLKIEEVFSNVGGDNA